MDTTTEVTYKVELKVNPASLRRGILPAIERIAGQAMVRQLRAVTCENQGHEWIAAPTDVWVPWRRFCTSCQLSED